MAEAVVTGDVALRAALEGIVANEERVTRDAVREIALRLITYAKKEASGPKRVGKPRVNRAGVVIPYRAGGPGVVTGHLRRGILPVREGRLDLHSWYVDVAPTAKYGRRLELGFVGTDSLGRRYNQPPYPFMKPARAKVAGEAERIVARAWRRGLKP